MTSDPALSFDNLERFVGRTIAQSDWMAVEQDQVDAFAAVTEDPDPMHVDPVWAQAASPYGRTVLAGLHMVALLPRMTRGSGLRIKGVRIAMNYGFNRVRFISPMPVAARFRNEVVLLEVERRDDGNAAIVTRNTFEIEGQPRPALIAEWVNLLWPETAAVEVEGR
jgi:acyl dehydratase